MDTIPSRGLADDGLMAEPEVEDFLKMSRSAINNLKVSGQLKTVKIGRSVRFLRRQVIEFAESLIEHGR